MAFDLFNSFDIDIPGLFNLLFQTNCSEQEHFLNDEKKTIVYYIYDSFIFAVQIPTLCLFFYENESQITLYLQCVGMLEKTSGRFCSYSFILCNLHSRRRFIPLYFLLLLSSTKIWELGLYDIRFSRIFAQIHFRQSLTENTLRQKYKIIEI